jgi:hypothetical protein
MIQNAKSRFTQKTNIIINILSCQISVTRLALATIANHQISEIRYLRYAVCCLPTVRFSLEYYRRKVLRSTIPARKSRKDQRIIYSTTKCSFPHDRKPIILMLWSAVKRIREPARNKHEYTILAVHIQISIIRPTESVSLSRDKRSLKRGGGL